jgi:hypothetical protein
MRERSGVRASIREIGDFVAHRAEREKGPVTQRARDVFTSLESWLRISVLRQPFTLEDIRRTAEANLRNATDVQLQERLGLKRVVAKSVLTQGLNKAAKGKQGTSRERRTVDYLGSAFIWNPAFTDIEVIEDLIAILNEAGLVRKADHASFHDLSNFVALYVLTLLHGSTIVMENGARATLFAGSANGEGRLEIKANLAVAEFKKPIFAPTCVFWTRLLAAEHCAPTLLDPPAQWTCPIEIGVDGKLMPLN